MVALIEHPDYIIKIKLKLLGLNEESIGEPDSYLRGKSVGLSLQTAWDAGSSAHCNMFKKLARMSLNIWINVKLTSMTLINVSKSKKVGAPIKNDNKPKTDATLELVLGILLTTNLLSTLYVGL